MNLLLCVKIISVSTGQKLTCVGEMDTICLFHCCKWSPSVDKHFLMIQHNLIIYSKSFCGSSDRVPRTHFENHCAKVLKFLSEIINESSNANTVWNNTINIDLIMWNCTSQKGNQSNKMKQKMKNCKVKWKKIHYTLCANHFLDRLQLFIDLPLKKACTSYTVQYVHEGIE